MIPENSKDLEVFAIKPDKDNNLRAYIGYKLPNNNFDFIHVPYTEPKNNHRKFILKDIGGYHYLLVNELAKEGEYSLTMTGKCRKVDLSKPILWQDGCYKVIATNNPEMLLDSSLELFDYEKVKKINIDIAHIIKNHYNGYFKNI